MSYNLVFDGLFQEINSKDHIIFNSLKLFKILFTQKYVIFFASGGESTGELS